MGTTTLLVLRGDLQTAIGADEGQYAGKYTDAIKNAIKQTYPTLHRPLEDRSLVTGNILPNAHFEDWASSSNPDFYSLTTATCAEETTSYRGQRGSSACKVTATSAGGYLYISSDTYPRLLDLMDKSVSAYVWANPQTADDGTVEIYTKQADGTEQTLTSTTSNPAGEFTLLKLEDQTPNDDLVEVQIRVKVTTNGQYVIYDGLRVVSGQNVYDYVLPTDVLNGDLAQVYVQISGYSEKACDDINPRQSSFSQVRDWDIVNDGTYDYLHFDSSYSTSRQIKLIGTTPLETLSADADTISLSGNKTDLLIFYAAYLLYEMQAHVVASKDISRYERAAMYWLAKYKAAEGRLGMTQPTKSLHIEW
jgi:hypothetical protein